MGARAELNLEAWRCLGSPSLGLPVFNGKTAEYVVKPSCCLGIMKGVRAWLLWMRMPAGGTGLSVQVGLLSVA